MRGIRYVSPPIQTAAINKAGATIIMLKTAFPKTSETIMETHIYIYIDISIASLFSNIIDFAAVFKLSFPCA